MFDHVSNAIKYIVIVIISFPQEGWGADHFVLLVHMSLVKKGSRSIFEKKKHLNEHEYMQRDSTNANTDYVVH